MRMAAPSGIFPPAALDERGELRDEGGDENDGNADAGENQERRIDHREDEAGLELGEGLQVVGLALENGVERAGRLTGGGERAIQRAEARADFFQGDGEIHPVADDLADFEGNGLEVAEFLAVFHRLERGLQLEAGAEHVGKFLGEEHDFLALQLDRAVGNRGFLGFRLAAWMSRLSSALDLALVLVFFAEAAAAVSLRLTGWRPFLSSIRSASGRSAASSSPVVTEPLAARAL